MLMSDRLRNAKAIIQFQGWGRGFRQDRAHRGSVCASEACWIALDGDPLLKANIEKYQIGSEMHQLLAEVVHVERHGVVTGVITYNDEVGRTRADIMAMFDKGIELALQREAANGPR